MRTPTRPTIAPLTIGTPCAAYPPARAIPNTAARFGAAKSDYFICQNGPSGAVLTYRIHPINEKHRARRAAEELAAKAAAADAAAQAGSADPADTLEDTLIAPEIEAGHKHGKRKR